MRVCFIISSDFEQHFVLRLNLARQCLRFDRFIVANNIDLPAKIFVSAINSRIVNRQNPADRAKSKTIQVHQQCLSFLAGRPCAAQWAGTMENAATGTHVLEIFKVLGYPDGYGHYEN